MIEVLVFQGGYTATVVSLGVIALGIAAGLLGSFLLLRGRALAADAVAHASLPGFALAFLVATLLGVDGKSTLVLGIGAVLAALLALWLIRRLEGVPRIKPDAAIGVVLSGSYALGLVTLSIVQALPVGGQAGLTAYLLGSTAGMLASEAIANGAVAVVVALAVLLAFKELAAVTFDPVQARLLGLPVGFIDAILLGLLLLLAVAALRSVGAILFVALVVLPAATARLWATRLSTMAAIAALVGAVGCHVGVAASAVVVRLPTGPAIVLTLAAMFLLSLLVSPSRGVFARVIEARRTASALAARLATERGAAR